MNFKPFTFAALGLICLTAAGCVSDGGSYARYDAPPRYDRVQPDRVVVVRPGYDRRPDSRPVVRPDRRNDRPGYVGGRPGPRGPQAVVRPGTGEGRWIIRDGRRVWVANRY